MEIVNFEMQISISLFYGENKDRMWLYSHQKDLPSYATFYLEVSCVLDLEKLKRKHDSKHDHLGENFAYIFNHFKKRNVEGLLVFCGPRDAFDCRDERPDWPLCNCSIEKCMAASPIPFLAWFEISRSY